MSKANRRANLNIASESTVPAESTESTEVESADSTAETAETASKRGPAPQMPVCVVWEEEGVNGVTAALIHPVQGEIRVHGRGVRGTMGSLEDEGYPLSAIRANGPKWVIAKIPPTAHVLGFAAVLGFPLPVRHQQ